MKNSSLRWRQHFSSHSQGGAILDFLASSLASNQPRSQGLSSLPLLVVGTARETLVAAGHVTTQNLGGRKICWKGGVFYRPLDQMYLSTHPPCGFGWIDGHVTSRNQGLGSTTKGGREERPWERGWHLTWEWISNCCLCYARSSSYRKILLGPTRQMAYNWSLICSTKKLFLPSFKAVTIWSRDKCARRTITTFYFFLKHLSGPES